MDSEGKKTMKISWAKVSMSMEVDYNLARNGFAEERSMLMKNLTEDGHQIEILTPITKDDEKTMEGVKLGKDYEERVSTKWLANIDYRPDGFSSSDSDILFIENGPLNFTFIDHHTGQPQLRRIMDIINHHEGLVFMYQSDPLLPFPLWRFSMADIPWSDSENTIRTTGRGEEECGWGDYDELFKNKRIVILTKAMKHDSLFLEMMSGPRFRYDYFYENNLIDFAFMQTGYDLSFINFLNRKWENKEYKLSYIGFPRSRIRSFKDFYGPFLTQTHTWGPWFSDSVRSKISEKLESEGMTWHGFVYGYPKICEAHAKTVVEFNLIPHKANQLGWISNRYFESVFCGCINLCDKSTFGMEAYCPEDMIVDEFSSISKVNEILAMSKQEYEENWDRQFRMVEGLNYGYISKFFVNLVKQNL